MLRLLLPPNLPAAAMRNAIPVRLELDLSAAPEPDLLPALALLQQWCGPGTPPKFLQLTRSQLRQLTDALREQPLFAWLNAPATPLAWSNGTLPGVSEHLIEKDTPPAPAAVAPPKVAVFSGEPMTVDGSEHYLAITLPSRESPHYAEALELLKLHGFILEPSNRKWWLRDRHKTLAFLADHLTRLRGAFGARFTPNFDKNTAHLHAAEVVCEAGETRDGFELSTALRCGNAGEAELRAAVETGRGYVESDGHIYLLDQTRLGQLAAAQRALTGDPAAPLLARRTVRIPAARAAEAQQIIGELSPHFAPPAAWKARTDALRQVSQLPPAPLPETLAAQLRPYQKLGTAWLWHLFGQKLGGVLADEMGLGKTLQALGLLSAVHDRAATNRAPSLVIAPASLLENWRRETARFAPQLRLFVHHGENRLQTEADFPAFDLVITSYGTLTRDLELFQTVGFACIVADEAQHIKNLRSQNARALRALRADARFLLTGTPLENSPDDLRSLFEFLLPGYLDRLPPSLRADERAWHHERLRARTAPYILRRTKLAVAPELPPKIEQIVWCEPTPAQSALYRRIQETTERELDALAATGASETRLKLAALTQLLRLRQVCCDPRLIAGSDSSAPDDEAETRYADSAKLEIFRELLAEAQDDGHRVLVFSQFTSLLALLRTELDAQQIPCCYLDGAMPVRQRQAAVDRFQNSPDIPVFLLSLKAGGTGLNLTAADTVIHFDPWWNPAVEAQATDRAHRIGQTRAVTSYKLIVSGSVEEKVLGLQQEKRALLASVFESSDALSAKLTLSDLRSLLKA